MNLNLRVLLQKNTKLVSLVIIDKCIQGLHMLHIEKYNDIKQHKNIKNR